MLNSKGIRELAYVIEIDDVRDIEGVNNQVAVVNGWTVFVKRDEFKAGDLAVYFEIDSKVPEKECFEFLRKYDFRIKTQRFVKGKVISQGLIIKPEDLGLKNVKVGDFLTEKLGVTYYEPEDNKRKADNSRYTSMMARHPKIFKSKFGKWIMKREWGRKLMFFFFGKKKDKKTDWPKWVVKTDEERVQNCFEAMKGLNKNWYVTEKIDGTSTTFTMKQHKNPKKRRLIVCSRNVVFDTPEKEDKNFYKDTDGNVYLEMAGKYNMKEVLSTMLDNNKDAEWITIQGETYGGSIQQRKYGNEHRLAIFNLIIKRNGEAPVRLDPLELKNTIIYHNNKYGFNLEVVPVLGCITLLDKTCEDMLEMAKGESKIDGGMREGIVLRTQDGVHSFKAVDNEFLMKYHN